MLLGAAWLAGDLPVTCSLPAWRGAELRAIFQLSRLGSGRQQKWQEKLLGICVDRTPPVQVLEGSPLTRGNVYLCSSLDEEQGLLSTFSRNSCWKLRVSITLSFPFLEPWTTGNLFMLGKKKEVASPCPRQDYISWG